MQLPDIIRLQVKCNEPCDLSGLIFQMRVQAGTKNSYYIEFPKTSKEGFTKITAEDFRSQFTDHHHFGLMDYNGSVESAVQAVYLDLLDTKRIAQSKEKLLQFSLMPHDRKKMEIKRRNN